MYRNELITRISELLDILYEFNDRGLNMLNYMSVYRKYAQQVNHNPYEILKIASDQELELYYNDIVAAIDDLDLEGY